MASSYSVSVPLLMKDKEPINWAELPQELMSSILLRLGMVEILLSAQKVCRSWRCVCKDPSMWRKIDMRGLRSIRYFDLDSLCRHVVDLSQGGLLEINISDFGSNRLLSYIADRSSNLRSLGIESCYLLTNQGLVNAITKLALLETLEISNAYFKLSLKDIGQACPLLRTLKLNSTGYVLSGFRFDDNDDADADEYALAIAESMPQLRHLQLIWDRVTDIVLNAILDNLHHLRYLDLRKCFNIYLVGHLEKRCLERIKELRRPNDSAADFPFDIMDHIYSDDDDAYDDEFDDEYDDAYEETYDYPKFWW